MLWIQPLLLPATITQRLIFHPVMQAVLTTLPEFHALRCQAESTPVIRYRNLIAGNDRIHED